MGNKWIVNLVRYYILMSSRHNQSQRQISNQEETENDIRSSIPDLAMGLRFICVRRKKRRKKRTRMHFRSPPVRIRLQGSAVAAAF